MALLDFLKNKKDAEKSKPAKSRKHLGGPASIQPKADLGGKPQKAEKPVVAKSTKIGRFSYDAIKQPHISEKASYLAEKDQYVFEISPNYNKQQVRDSVEGIYGVDVLSVNIIRIPSKKRRLGKTEGFRKAYKKAVVTIKNGQKIEIL